MKARRLLWTETARSDLALAYRYLADLNEPAADRLILDLESKARAVAALGLSGRDRSELAPDVRSIAYRSRILFFRTTPDEVIILRVLHGHQNISADFFAEEQQED